MIKQVLAIRGNGRGNGTLPALSWNQSPDYSRLNEEYRMFRERKLLAIAFTLLMSGAAQAAIYKSTDARGNVVYTDTPSKEAKAIELPPLSIVPSLTPEQIAQATTGAQVTPQPANIRYQLSFVQPVAEQTVRKPDAIAINVNVQPVLANGDNLSILLDGVVVANGNATSVATEKMDRGAHGISARITNAAGRVVSEAATTVYVQQNTLNSPASQANKPAPAKR